MKYSLYMTLYEMHCDFTLKYDNVLTTNTSPLFCTLIKNYFLVSRQNFDMYKQLETGQGVLNTRRLFKYSSVALQRFCKIIIFLDILTNSLTVIYHLPEMQSWMTPQPIGMYFKRDPFTLIVYMCL